MASKIIAEAEVMATGDKAMISTKMRVHRVPHYHRVAVETVVDRNRKRPPIKPGLGQTHVDLVPRKVVRHLAEEGEGASVQHVAVTSLEHQLPMILSTFRRRKSSTR